MYQSSFKKMTRNVPDHVPLVSSLTFEELESGAPGLEHSPIYCQSCNSALVGTDLQSLGGNRYRAQCPFCLNATEIVLNVEQVQQIDSARPQAGMSTVELSYLMEAIRRGDPTSQTEASQPPRNTQAVVVAVDLSGSMSRPKLEAVKQNLTQSIVLP
jgi:hypothetical protein